MRAAADAFSERAADLADTFGGGEAEMGDAVSPCTRAGDGLTASALRAIATLDTCAGRDVDSAYALAGRAMAHSESVTRTKARSSLTPASVPHQPRVRMSRVGARSPHHASSGCSSASSRS
jgi:hypothetical protein